MTKGRTVSFLVAALLATPSAACAQSGAAAAVRAIYAAYETAQKTNGSPPDLFDKRRYTARVGREIAKMKRACKGDEMCGSGADFLIEGQDFQITGVKVREVAAAGDGATVEATFKNFGNGVRRIFTMRQENGRWLIDDIDLGGGRRLKDELKPNP